MLHPNPIPNFRAYWVESTQTQLNPTQLAVYTCDKAGLSLGFGLGLGLSSRLDLNLGLVLEF